MSVALTVLIVLNWCQQGYSREKAPFVLTPDFEYVMGKRVSLK